MLALAAVALLWGVGERPLYAPDEGRYAAIALEMVTSGDWVVPRLTGVPYVDKPPLLYWLEAAGIVVFGPNEWGVRALPALVAWLGVALTLALGRALYDEETGIIAAAVLASTALWVGVGRALLTDGILSVALLGAFLCLERVRSGRPGALGIWLCLATATLAKGPIGPALFALAVGLLWIARERPPFARLRLVLGPVLFAALALPWFVAVDRRVPGAAAYFFLNQNLAALFQSGIHHAAPWYAAFPMLAAGFAPWSLLGLICLPSAAKLGWLSLRTLSTSAALLLCWCAAVFGVFTLSVSKLATYFLPLYPALAVLVARLFLHASPRRSTALALGALGVAVPGAAVAVLHTPSSAELVAAFAGALAATAAGLITAGALRWTGRTRAAALALPASLALAILLAAPSLDTASPTRASRALLLDNAGTLARCDPLVSAGFAVGMVEFYLRRPVLVLGRARTYRHGLELEPDAGEFLDEADLGALLAGHPRACLLVKQERAPDLLGAHPALTVALRDARYLVLSAQAPLASDAAVRR